MQLQGIVFIQLQGNDLLVNCKEIDSFKGHIFIHKKYNHSRQLHSFTESFISRNLSVHSREYILVQGKHIHSGTYLLKDIYLNLRNIYSFKFLIYAILLPGGKRISYRVKTLEMCTLIIITI